MPIAVFDCHADTPVALWHKSQSLASNQCHISLSRAGELPHYAQFFAYCSYAGADFRGYDSPSLYALPRAYMDRQIALCQDQVCFCTNAAQVEQAWQEDKMAALYSIEGAEVIGCDPGRLEQAWADGVRMTTLTWNADNALAGFHQGNQTGLTAAGREFFRRAQSLGILVDVSHCSDRAFFDMMELAEAPVVASHSNSRAVMPHSRNLTDEMFRALCQTRGLAGINLYGAFLSRERATFEDVYAHIDHFLQLDGSDTHVGLGGDLDGCDVLPEGFGSISDYNSLAEFLQSKYPKKTVERLFYQNILNIMRGNTV